MLSSRRLSVLSFFTLLSRITGQIRATIWASLLSVSPLADSFFLPIKLPSMLRAYFAEGAMNAAFVPTYSRMLDGKPEIRRVFLRRIAILLSLAVLGLTALVQGLAGQIVEFYLLFSSDDIVGASREVWVSQTATLIRITFFYLFFISATSLIGSILHSHHITSPLGFNPVVFNLLNIAGGALIIAVGAHWQAFDVAKGLAYCLVIAGAAQAAHMLLSLYRFRKYRFGKNWQAGGVKPPPSLQSKPLKQKQASELNERSKDNGLDALEQKPQPPPPSSTAKGDGWETVSAFFKKLSPVAFASLVHHINILLLDPIAISLGVGAVATLFYSNRLLELPLGLLAFPLATVSLPKLAKISQSKSVESAKTLEYMMGLLWMFLVPTTMVAIYYRYEIAAIVFRFGALSEADARAIGEVFLAHALALPALGLTRLLTTAFYASDNVKRPLIAAVISLITSLSFAFILTSTIGEVYAIALASSLSAYAMVIYLLVYAKQSLGVAVAWQTVRKLLVYTSLAVIPFVFAALFTKLLSLTLEQIRYTYDLLWVVKGTRLLELIFFSAFFFLFYGLALRAANDKLFINFIQGFTRV